MVFEKGSRRFEGQGKSNGMAGGSRGNRNAIDNGGLVDKNGNVLPPESKSKREEKCQEKRQGLKTTVNPDANTKETKPLASNGGELLTRYTSSDGTMYEVDGTFSFGFEKFKALCIRRGPLQQP